MTSKIFYFVTAVLVLSAGCSNKGGKTEMEVGTATKESVPPSVDVNRAVPKVLLPSSYSDDTWTNGINRKTRNQFFFTLGKTDPTPLMPGFVLNFHKSGESTIQNVYRMESTGGDSLFVTVNKALDPAGDGNPNSVEVKIFRIQAANYSKDKTWRQGIYLGSPGVFYLFVGKKVSLPFKVGDRLRFAYSGDARVKEVARTEEGPVYSNVFVTVDKALEPAGDGNPKPIDVIF